MRRLVVALAWAVACAPSAADHEELGDRAYAAGSHADALAEYRLALRVAPGRAGLHAKTAAAALRMQDYTLAAQEYRALAASDRSRADEAAEGLERVVRAALGANDRLAGERALAWLRSVQPSRPLGRYARPVAVDAMEQGRFTEARALLPSAIAAAPDGRSADSLLFLYGMAAAQGRDCATAVPVFEAVLRRRHEPAVADGAREGLGLCALIEGQKAVEAGRREDAESWCRRASAPGAAPDVVRAAYLCLGDLRMAEGDLPGALEQYQAVLQGGTPGDSLSVRAQHRMNALGRAEPPTQP